MGKVKMSNPIEVLRRKGFLNRGFWYLSAVVYVLCAAMLLSPALGSSRFLFGTDTYSHDYIMHLYGWRQIFDGYVPLWCPYMFCGTPFIGSFALCPFYPSQLFYFIFPHNTSFTLQYVLALAVGAFNFAVWMRTFGLRRGVAFWGGLAFMLSGHFLTLTYAGHLQKMIAIAWAPLALAGARRMALRERGAFSRDGWITSLAFGMQLLASHFQIFYATFAACLIQILVEGGVIGGTLDAARGFSAGNKHWASALRRPTIRLSWLGLAVLGGFALGAIQFLPGAEMSSVSNRAHGVSYSEAVETSYPPMELLEYVIPRVLGDSVQNTDSPYFGGWGERIVSDFLGVPLLMLACIGVAAASRKTRLYLLVLVGLSLVVGVGYYTPVYKGLYYAMPGFRSFRSPGTFMFVADLSLVALAALGLDRLRTIQGKAHLWGVIGAIGLCAAGFATYQIRGVQLDIATPFEAHRYQIYRGVGILGAELGVTALLLYLASRRGVIEGEGDIADDGSRAGMPDPRLGKRRVVVAIALVAVAVPLVHNSHFLVFNDLGPYMSYLERQPVYSALGAEKMQPLRMLEERDLKNDNILHEVGCQAGYHPVILGRYERLVQAVGYASERFALMFDLNFAHTYTANPPAGEWTLDRQFTGQWLWQRTSQARYVKGGTSVVEMNEGAESVKLLREGIVQAAGTAIVPEGTLDTAGCSRGVQNASGELVSWQPGHIRVRVESQGRALLPLAEVYAPGWKAATDDHIPVARIPVNIAQESLVVPDGKTGISLDYKPFSFRLGAFVSLFSAGVFVLFATQKRAKAFGHFLATTSPQRK